MKVTLLPSAVAAAGDEQNQFLTSFLINDAVAIDAGSLGLYRSPHEQARIKHIFLSHSHIDHLASLPIFAENAYEGNRDCVTVHGSVHVLDCLQRDIFNDRIWPDFIRLSTDNAPFLKLAPLAPGQPVEVEGLRITPVEVNHIVPTFGFLVEDGAAAVVIGGDTGPTDAIWQYANRTVRLKGVFLEATFPNAMAWLADVARHLTPSLFAQEIRKVHRPVRFLAMHIKPRFYPQVINELRALALPNLEIGQAGKAYEF